jgi:hypothetical protein
VQDLKTGSRLKNVNTIVTVINNFTANVGTGKNKGTPNGDFFNILRIYQCLTALSL